MNTDVPEDAVRAALGHCEELEHLGDGGQGLVWRVRRNGRDDVIKVVPEADPARVDREMDGLQAVASDHVMKYRGALIVEQAGSRWPALLGEYIPGGTVADKLKLDSWPTLPEALTCVRGVLVGLAALHATELVHRDIKPENVALRDGAWENSVVLDLGLVRDLAATSITQYPQILGTVPFMAPEQLRGERAVQRTDVFAAGVLLFYLLTRELPFAEAEDVGLDGPALRRAMLPRTESDDWPRWSRVQDRLDQDVADTLSRLIATEAYQRPRVEQAIQRVDELLAGRT